MPVHACQPCVLYMTLLRRVAWPFCHHASSLHAAYFALQREVCYHYNWSVTIITSSASYISPRIALFNWIKLRHNNFYFPQHPHKVVFNDSSLCNTILLYFSQCMSNYYSYIQLITVTHFTVIYCIVECLANHSLMNATKNCSCQNIWTFLWSFDWSTSGLYIIQRVRIINIIYINTIFNLIHSIIFNLIHSITTMSVDVSYNFHCYISFMHS